MNILNKATRKLEFYKNIHKKRNADSKDNSNSVNWAILGLGNMANTFTRALITSPGANVIAAASRSQQKSEDFARKYGIPHVYGSYEAMLEDKSLPIDVVYIATPVFCHYENIKTALLNGKNVLCEKPIVMDLNELEELRDLANKQNLLLVEGMWMLYLPTFKKAGEWIAKEIIGEIQGIRVDLSKREAIDYSNSKYTAKDGSGVLLDYGIYPIAFAANYIDSDISVTYSNCIKHKGGFDKDWTIVLSGEKYSATITISSDFDGSRKATLIGRLGTIVWDSQFNRTNTVSCYDAEGKQLDSFSAKYIAGGLEYEIEEVQNCILEHKTETLSVPINASIKVLKIMETLRKN